MSMTITDFLLARIAEDETVARAAVRGDDSERWNAERDWTGSSDEWTLASASTRTIFRCCKEGRNLDAEVRRANEALAPLGMSEAPIPGIENLHGDGRGIGVATEQEVRHIARHDPARVLAECEAKRRIVELFPDAAQDGDGWNDAGYSVLRDLAAVYADHPDYREEWRL